MNAEEERQAIELCALLPFAQKVRRASYIRMQAISALDPWQEGRKSNESERWFLLQRRFDFVFGVWHGSCSSAAVGAFQQQHFHVNLN